MIILLLKIYTARSYWNPIHNVYLVQYMKNKPLTLYTRHLCIHRFPMHIVYFVQYMKNKLLNIYTRPIHVSLHAVGIHILSIWVRLVYVYWLPFKGVGMFHILTAWSDSSFVNWVIYIHIYIYLFSQNLSRG